MYETLKSKFGIDASEVLKNYEMSAGELAPSSVWITESEASAILGLLENLAKNRRPQSRIIPILAKAVEKAGNYYVPVGDDSETSTICLVKKELQKEKFGWSFEKSTPGIMNQRPTQYKLIKNNR